MKTLIALFLVCLSMAVQAQSSYFAKIDNGLVAEVIAATQDVVDSRQGSWIRTWDQANGDPAKRYNYAGKGDVYDLTHDAFYKPKPYSSWSLDSLFIWQAPAPMPTDGRDYIWDEDQKAWIRF